MLTERTDRRIQVLSIGSVTTQLDILSVYGYVCHGLPFSPNSLQSKKQQYLVIKDIKYIYYLKISNLLYELEESANTGIAQGAGIPYSTVIKCFYLGLVLT